MSYSKFEYSDLKLSNKSFAKIGKIEVSVTLKNNSNIAGKEVVQLYIRDLLASTTRPVKELKDFEMIELEPNEPKIVKFYITRKQSNFIQPIINGKPSQAILMFLLAQILRNH